MFSGSASKLMKKVFLVGALCMLTIVFLASCANGNSTSNANSPNTVHMNDMAFLQSSITIKKGESVTLTDDVSTIHIIANGTWDSNGTAKPMKEPGAPSVQAQFNGNDSQTFGPFNTSGTYHLYCTVHPNMNLTVIVK